MGNVNEIVRTSWGHYWETFVTEKAAAPAYHKGPTFDPNLGFEEPRQERVMIATQEEMDAANLMMHERDYCAHLLIDWRKCMRNNMPCFWRCKHRKHTYLECEYDDAVMRFKEYERERRLKKRQLALEGKDANGKLIEVK